MLRAPASAGGALFITLSVRRNEPENSTTNRVNPLFGIYRVLHD